MIESTKIIKKKKSRATLVSMISILVTVVLILSCVGIYLKISNKEKRPNSEVNPLDFSIDTWEGGVSANDFNENYAGRGSETKTINSASAFVYFIEEVNNGNTFENYTIYLNSNIDFNDQTIPSISGTFKGVFDGSFYTLMNAKINGNALFEETENATIKNVGLYNSRFSENTNSLINKATNTNVENTFVRLGSAVLVNRYISSNGEHYIKNSFVDSEGQGLINKLDTKSSSENKVTIESCYFTKGNVSILNTVGESFVSSTHVTKASATDFTNWNYSSEYDATKDWCDYDYKKNSNKLDFTYPLQTGFVKVYLTGSYYESIVVSGDSVVDAANLVQAIEVANGETEAKINLLAEKVFMEARAEVNNAEVTINAVKDTTIVRGENNTDSMFVATGNSKITIGETSTNARATVPTITLDGNREYIEENNLTSGALVVANGGEVEIHENVVIKDNVNNNEVGYGGAIILANAQEDVKIGARFENCSSSNGGGAVAIIGQQDTNLLVGSFHNCHSDGDGGALYIAEELPTEETQAMRTLYGKNLTIRPTTNYTTRQTNITTIDGNDTFTNCTTTADGGAICIYSSNLTISGTATFTGNKATSTYSIGGAINIASQGYALIITETGDATFTGNTSVYGGGAVNVDGEGSSSDDWTDENEHVVIAGKATFTNNKVTGSGGYHGGAIQIDRWGNIRISGTATFKGNTATLGGGAIFARGNITISGTAIFGGENEGDGNTAKGTYGYGGAIRQEVGYVRINGVATFVGNTASTDGGAIFGNVKINGEATFTGNTATSGDGGAIYVYGDVTVSSGARATFTSNSASSHGGAISGGATINAGATATFTHNTASYGGAMYGTNLSRGLTINGSVTLEDNYKSSATVSTQYELYNPTSITLGADLNVLSTSGVNTFYIGSSQYIIVTAQLNKSYAVYKASAAVYKSYNSESYIFYAAASVGLTGVGGTVPFRVTNAPSGTAVAYNTITGYYVLTSGITVTLNANGGTCSNTSTVVINATPYGYLPTPTKSGYIFLGWFTASSGGTQVTSTTNVSKTYAHTLYAQYIAVYVITWKNYDDTILFTESVTYGSTPTYGGQTPTRPETVQYTYTFSGWSPAVVAVTSNTTYTAQFTQTTKEYTITWKNYDGTTLSTDSVAYGSTPSYGGSTPTKPSTVKYEYTFSGWSPTVSNVVGNATYTAQFTESLRSYTITWKNYDGTTLSTESVASGSTPTYSGSTPTKPSTAVYEYIFSGWSPEISEVTGNATYTAQFTERVVPEDLDSVSATIVGRDEEDEIFELDNLYSTTLEETEVLYYYFEISSSDESVINSVTTSEQSYEAAADTTEAVLGLGAAYGEGEGLRVYKSGSTTLNIALYVRSSTAETSTCVGIYTVDVTISSGSTVSFGVNQTGWGTVSEPIEVPNGSDVSVSGNVLTIGEETIIATPAEPDENYTYAFDSWSTLPSTITEDVLIVANFVRSERYCTISFAVNDNEYGYVDITSLKVEVGTEISFDGNTISIGEETITAIATVKTAEATYTFKDWTGKVNTVTTSSTITAEFEKTINEYTITIAVNDATYGSLSGNTTITATYGTAISVSENRISINGKSATATAKTSDEQYVYEFANWSGVTEKVIQDATITAVFARENKQYTVTFVSGNTNYGQVSVVSFKADYGAKVNVQNTIVSIGSNYSMAIPTDSSDQYAYILESWSIRFGTGANTTITANTAITGDATITANFTQTVKQYTVNVEMNDSNAGIISNSSVVVNYGATIVVSENVITITNTDGQETVVTATANGGYKFNKWIGVVGAIEGDITITAYFIAE